MGNRMYKHSVDSSRLLKKQIGFIQKIIKWVPGILRNSSLWTHNIVIYNKENYMFYMITEANFYTTYARYIGYSKKNTKIILNFSYECLF